ncbi:hypothetical protein ACFFGV_10685 [Pontibacillus salicampi]|uniref:Uncharacterized protein n=1 Tax=Pontibacillus salicampi TaxID=1449801 RepID=A0ABV6LNR2_9BACI
MKSILRWLIVTALSFVLVIGAFAFKFSDTLFQEGNPLPIMKGIIQIQLGEAMYVPIDKDENRFIAPYKPKEEQTFTEAKQFMGSKGWAFERQSGRDLIFSKEDQDTIVVKTVMYTSDYYIFDVKA